jgi:DNA-directed RNA polymerase subunit RPC12/RpoP
MRKSANAASGDEDVRKHFCNKLFPPIQNDSGYETGEQIEQELTDAIINKKPLQVSNPAPRPPPAGKEIFRCGICSRAFNRKGDLKTHMDIHEKPKWKCPYCSASLSRRDKLRDHIKTIHEDVTAEHRNAFVKNYDPDRDNGGSAGNEVASLCLEISNGMRCLSCGCILLSVHCPSRPDGRTQSSELLLQVLRHSTSWARPSTVSYGSRLRGRGRICRSLPYSLYKPCFRTAAS